MQRIAFYDLDKTITRRASFPPFIGHVIRKYRPSRIMTLPAMLVYSLLYLGGIVSRSRLKERNLGLLVGHHPRAVDLQQMAESFARETLRTNILAPALAQMEADRRDGYRIVIASASFDFYVAAIGKLLGVLDVIATELRVGRDGHYESIISGKNCYGPEKLVTVEDWMNRSKFERFECHIRFYSDHISDAPCLEWADEAFATNAHQPLKDLATAKGWTCLDWLHQV